MIEANLNSFLELLDAGMLGPKTVMGAKDMKDNNLFIESLISKVLLLLGKAGTEGLTKTRLLQLAHCKTDVLAKALKIEEDAFHIVGRQMRKSEFGLGRQPHRYWLKEFAPQEILTAQAPSVTPTLDPEPGAAPPRGGTCRQCGGAIASRGPGSLPEYCSPACRSLATEGGLTLGRFLDRAHDPLVFAQLTVLLVEMDLLCRGYYVARDTLYPGARLIVHNGTDAVFLTVIPLASSGYLPPANTYACMAIVYRDGRIVYGGTNPLDFGENKTEAADVKGAQGGKELAPEPEKFEAP